MRFSLILFDLDGTLVDSAPDIANALNLTLAEAGLATLPPADVATYVGDGATKLVQRAHPAGSAADVPELVERFRAHYARHICDQTRPYPGIVELLTLLAPARPLAVLTNKPGDLARSLLRALSLDRYFVDIIGDGDGFPRKPAPDAARWLLARHGVPAAETLVVGDGLPDLRVAREIGCQVAAAAWGYVARDLLSAEAPDWILETPRDLLAIINREP